MIGADGLVPLTDGGFYATGHGAMVLAMIELILPVGGLDLQVFGCPLNAQQNGLFRRVRYDHFTFVAPLAGGAILFVIDFRQIWWFCFPISPPLP